MEVQVVGIDLDKTLFHLVGVDSSGSVVVRKRCSRSQLLAFTANLRVQRIGMEACSGSHFLGRALRDQGHDVRLMPAQAARQERFSQKALLAYEGSSGGWPNSHVLD
jgi:transposase